MRSDLGWQLQGYITRLSRCKVSRRLYKCVDLSSKRQTPIRLNSYRKKR